MTRYDLAQAVAGYFPTQVLEQFLRIGEDGSNCHVELEFKAGRCLRVKVTNMQQFRNEDFTDSIDNVGAIR